MNKVNTIFCLLSFFLLLLGSCENVVEVEFPEHDPKLVVNGVFNPDSLFTVDLSASQSVISNKAHQQVEDGKVALYREGTYLFDFQHLGNGIYQADARPEALQEYELRLSAPGFPEAGARLEIPAAPLLSELEAEIGPIDEGSGWPSVDVSFVLEDDPGQEDFYYLQVFSPDTTWDGQEYQRVVWTVSMSPVEEEFEISSRMFFSDKLFNGQKLKMELNLENHPERINYIRVAHITEAYYQYSRTFHKQAYGDNFDITPISVNNNIQNGMGLLGGCNMRVLEVKP